MTDLRIYQIDAFTTQRFQGNPAGVVANAQGLGEADMQAIARELNNSETAFILPAEGEDHDVRVRFFTPATEVPVCGHATIAAHFVLALEGRAPGGCRQLTGAGIQRVTTRREQGDVVITIEQGRPSFAPLLPEDSVDAVADALGVARSALDPRCPMQFVSTGHGKLLIGVRDRPTLDRLAPDPQKLVALADRAGARGFFVFTLDTAADDDASTWGRMFAPAIGITEDPVTGNANGPLGAYLVKHGLIGSGQPCVVYRARQRAANGRHGWMDVRIDVEAGEPTRVCIEGRAVECFQARMRVD